MSYAEREPFVSVAEVAAVLLGEEESLTKIVPLEEEAGVAVRVEVRRIYEDAPCAGADDLVAEFVRLSKPVVGDEARWSELAAELTRG